jgi:hypothetical protein
VRCSSVTSGRMAAYLLVLNQEPHDGGITSERLSELTGINATQVRRDLSQTLGHAGRRGVGYKVRDLHRLIVQLLKDAEIGSAAAVMVSSAPRPKGRVDVAERLEEFSVIVHVPSVGDRPANLVAAAAVLAQAADNIIAARLVG